MPSKPLRRCSRCHESNLAVNLFCFSGVFQPVYAERENNPFAFILRRIFRGAGTLGR